MKSILLVDDDRYALEALQLQLRPYSGEWEVTAANGGLEALPLTRRLDFDLLIANVHMPDQLGFGTISAVRNIRPKMKVLAITGNDRFAGEDLAQLSRSLGTIALLERPYSPRVLLDTVRRVLASKELNSSLP